MRKVQTSLYVNESILKEIENAAKNSNIKPNDLIVFLLRKYLKENRKSLKLFKRLEYQMRDSTSQWKTHHVSINAVDYELFTDMRKLFKKSVSLMLKLAVCKYIFDLENQELDNYCKIPYRIENVIEQNGIIWSIFWHKTLLRHRKRK